MPSQLPVAVNRAGMQTEQMLSQDLDSTGSALSVPAQNERQRTMQLLQLGTLMHYIAAARSMQQQWGRGMWCQ